VDEIFLILLGIAWALGTPLIAIVALVRTAGLRAQNERLAADLASADLQLRPYEFRILQVISAIVFACVFGVALPGILLDMILPGGISPR